MAMILQFENVAIAYGGVCKVKDISFSLEEGQILGIVGESGSGKTTVIRAAMGLLGDAGRIVNGKIRFDKTELSGLGKAERRRLNGPGMGMVFQSAGSSFCQVRKIGAQFYEAMNGHGHLTRKDFYVRANGILKSLGFHETERILDSYPFELSGGMQQRVGIAAAMLLQPKVLFADEPTSALDVHAKKLVMEEMLMVRREFGTAIVLVSHDIGVVEAMADRVLVMRDGSMVEYGTVDQVLGSPQMAYTKLLLSAAHHKF